MNDQITVQTTIYKDIDDVWKSWIDPEQITQWYFASEDWECPIAVNDFKIGGAFSYRMAAKDGSMAFDFDGIYDEVIEHEMISFSLSDSRKVCVLFSSEEDKTKVVETFDPDDHASVEMQEVGWQAILNSFKVHVEPL
jgi:uncharacterized protein YndB with AHSA1/START domain